MLQGAYCPTELYIILRGFFAKNHLAFPYHYLQEINRCYFQDTGFIQVKGEHGDIVILPPCHDERFSDQYASGCCQLGERLEKFSEYGVEGVQLCIIPIGENPGPEKDLGHWIVLVIQKTDQGLNAFFIDSHDGIVSYLSHRGIMGGLFGISPVGETEILANLLNKNKAKLNKLFLKQDEVQLNAPIEVRRYNLALQGWRDFKSCGVFAIQVITQLVQVAKNKTLSNVETEIIKPLSQDYYIHKENYHGWLPNFFTANEDKIEDWRTEQLVYYHYIEGEFKPLPNSHEDREVLTFSQLLSDSLTLRRGFE